MSSNSCLPRAIQARSFESGGQRWRGIEGIKGQERGSQVSNNPVLIRSEICSSSKRSKPTLTLPAPLSLEGSLSEEVLLRCLSFLTAHDLVTVSRVSSAWYRLSQDPQVSHFSPPFVIHRRLILRIAVALEIPVPSHLRLSFN